MKKQTQIIKDQRGNALFLILIAVALFAALSYAVTQSGRGGGSIAREQALIAASQITQYPATMRTAITRMMITGSTASDVAFDTSSPSGADEVFATDGGGVVEQTPPSSSGATAWGYKDLNHASNGYYIDGVGTDTDVSGRDAIAYLDDVTLAVCNAVNTGLGISTLGVNTAAVDYTTNTNTGAATKTTTNDFDGSSGEAFACVQNAAGGNYVYYHALIEQ